MAEFMFFEKKPMDGRELKLEADATIGREGCDVVLRDPEVYRRHAALRMTGSGPAVEDLGSSNGTFVNAQRIEGVRQLNEGDVVRFGNTEWELRGAPVAGAGVGAPQVTAARPVPTAPHAAAPPAAPDAGRRGDVPQPPEVTPSAIRRTLPESAAAAPPAFAPVATKATRGSAATRAGYTAFCFAIFVAALVGVVVYFIVN